MKATSIALLSVAAVACAQDLPTAPGVQPPSATGVTFGGEAKGSVPRNFRAHLSGDQEVPARDTRAQGEAVFQLSADGSELSYRVMVANIENVVSAGIYLGLSDANGPIIICLVESRNPGEGRTDGVLVRGTLTTTGPVLNFTSSPSG